MQPKLRVWKDAGRLSELSVIRGGMGIWHGPRFRGMGLMTHGLQSRVGRPVTLSIHRQSTDAAVDTRHARKIIFASFADFVVMAVL